MTIAFILRFLIILLAMLVAAAAGYIISRNRAEQRNALQIAMMSAEISKMRRRASNAEAEASRAAERMMKEKRRNRRQ